MLGFKEGEGWGSLFVRLLPMDLNKGYLEHTLFVTLLESYH